ELPPFQGGAAGLLAYELNRAWEDVPRSMHDEFGFPALAVGIYDWTIAWDHRQCKAWIIAHGFSGTDREQSANTRIDQIKELLNSGRPAEAAQAPERFPIEKLGDVFPLADKPGLLSDFSREGYLRAVDQVIEYIRAGDVFQANLSQRMLFPQQDSILDLYGRLRSRNPATFSALMMWDDWAVASASPERFLCVRDREVESRPIKGTRPRGVSPEAELFTRDELRESEKDMAENVMIVDLMRNDLSRVCLPGSVSAPELCLVESYESVQHLVSEIRGRLKPESSVFDLLAATFPGGSITGAPKIRAMEIIAELEPTVRGPYCGSLIYLGFDGWFDSSILIRTFAVKDGWIQCSVGGGIVAQSSPAAEYEETLHKAHGMLSALE
ncbi:MAG TPA: aminodeoxychorismate synthase component I, partial [Planctomycetaceae bacterium]|nr:aminodeoxychorismate synthase component I [Planctomycetaceae bacterium]